MKTVLLLRHADIDLPAGPEPAVLPLNAAGRARAEELARVVGGAGVTAVFVSPALRTQQTAEPLTTRLGIPFQVGETVPDLVQGVLADAAGPVVVLVGHSDTVPAIVTALGVPFPGTIQGHDDLFIVTVAPGGASLLRLKYGSPPAPAGVSPG
jgi:broad specificity phosphatase PhoE